MWTSGCSTGQGASYSAIVGPHTYINGLPVTGRSSSEIDSFGRSGKFKFCLKTVLELKGIDSSGRSGKLKFKFCFETVLKLESDGPEDSGKMGLKIDAFSR
jgi:hypothetical protein